MVHPSSSVIERRPILGSKRGLSAVAIAVDPPAVAPPATDARWVALLRRARERGVTTFDVADARFPERAERMIANAFPTLDPEIGVMVGRSVESLATERGEGPGSLPEGNVPSALATSLDRSRQRLAPVPVSVVIWELEAGEGSAVAQAPTPLPRSPTGEGEFAWAVRLPERVGTLPSVEGPPVMFAGEYSLLNTHPILLFDRSRDAARSSFIARDPFAGGRLDGSRLASMTTPGGPGEGPIDVRRLHSEFDPVLRLGFLTGGRRRTLAQAALRFVLSWPWVATTVIPLPSPERFEEILAFGSSPPLDDGEWANLGLVK